MLPAARAIVNPNQPGCTFPSKCIAGVGVMFYVLLALRAQLRERGAFGDGGMPEPRLDGLLDLVALGTVADVVKLDGNNRVLVAQGLARIRARPDAPGVAALFRAAGPRCSAALGLRPRLRARAAPERRGAAFRHVARHRVPDLRTTSAVPGSSRSNSTP